MKTLLVPVDFTSTSDNAVNFAAKWAKRYQYERIILYKSFYDSMFENIGIAAEYSNVNQDFFNKHRDDASEQLRELENRLSKQIDHEIKVFTAVSEDPLLRGMIEIIQEGKPELVVIGSDSSDHSSESIIAGNIISIAKISPVRVLIVPADYAYQEVDHALIPFDFNTQYPLDVLKTLAVSPLWRSTKIFVLNVDAKGRYLKQDAKLAEAEKIIHNYLHEFDHEIHYSNENNVVNAVTNFSTKYPLQLIVALPGKSSFLYSLTHKSIAEAIYQNRHLPVLILK